MFSISFVIAENQDVGVIAGATTESDLVTEDIEASSTFGAIVSSIQSNVERFIDFAGLKVWKDTTGTTQIQDFDLIAFPTGSVVDLNDVVVGSVCATSEEVEIRGVIGIFETNCIQAIAVQGLSGYGDEMLFDDGYTVLINSLNGDYLTEINWMNDGTQEIGSAFACNDPNYVGICPVESEVEAHFSISFEALGDSNLRYRLSEPETDRYVYLVCDELDVLDCDNGEAWSYFIESDNEITDFSFDSTLNGFQTSSQAGQSLLIADAQSYDIYGVIL